jgi:hypothetical protein
MANSKISGLTAATTPLAGTEEFALLQTSDKRIAVANFAAGAVKSNATTGIMQIVGPAAGEIRVATIPNTNFTVAQKDAAQTLTGNQTISNGNIVVSSGYGIDFSATAGTGTSELLTDYEEGTWTASIRGQAIAGTYEIALNRCYYTKIGRLVTLQGYIEMASAITGGGSGYLQINGLPYQKHGTSAPQGVVALDGVDYTATASLTVGFDSNTGTSEALWIYETNDNVSISLVNISGVSANDGIYINITYEV